MSPSCEPSLFVVMRIIAEANGMRVLEEGDEKIRSVLTRDGKIYRQAAEESYFELFERVLRTEGFYR